MRWDQEDAFKLTSSSCKETVEDRLTNSKGSADAGLAVPPLEATNTWTGLFFSSMLGMDCADKKKG